jgi:UDP-galactopyranose mutase
MSCIVVLSHLRWNFVYQRPQHLMSRLAAYYRIVFMEEPVPGATENFLERIVPCPGVEILRPHVTGDATGYNDVHAPMLQRLLAEYLRNQNINDYWVWFYTPLALPVANGLKPKGIIYDCMDELSAFKNASPQLIERERELFGVADIVFTGGPSLYQSKRKHHDNVHCFASSVDAAHFAPDHDEPEIRPDHMAQDKIPHPRLGYFGVIDERLDIDLIRALADAYPEWQIVMVGPVVKIDPATLPIRQNIHWLGQHSYADLPHLVAGWDVCLLPFAINEATRFISPTKTLEYMAAEKPVVSTPIRDVVEPYSHVVSIAHTPENFIAACAALLQESEEQRVQRIATMRDIVAKTSWDMTASVMHELIEELESGIAETAHAIVPLANTHKMYGDTTGVAEKKDAYQTIILGAGPTGLSAAYHLGKGSLLLERKATVGGWCRSIEDKGFTFDYAGHIMFSNDPYVLELYKKLLGDNMHWQNREAWIYSKNVYTRYPFQGALYGLPPEVLKECVVGAIEARFGPLKKEDRRAAPNTIERRGNANYIGEAKPPQNFEEFIYKVWGAGVAKHFAIPYNQKLWAVPLNEMETSWLGNRVPMPDLEEMIEGALKPVAKPMGPNARFGYPLRGGFQALMDGFLPLLEGDMELNADVVAISPSRRTVTLKDGRSYRYENMISTLPLPKLVEAIGSEAPQELQAAAKGLRHVSVRCVNLGIGRANISEKHWVYYPEDTVFHRIFLQGNASPYCNAPGGFGLTCEITYSEYKPLPCEGEALIQRCIDDCIRVGMINKDDSILAANEVDMPYAYVVYDHARASNVELIRSWLAEVNIVLSGRYSEWEYYNSDHAFVAGKKAAEQVANHKQQSKLAAHS